MNLIIDIGNTLTKFSVFEKDSEVFFEQKEIIHTDTVLSILNRFPKIQNCILSATGEVPEGAFKELKNHINFCLEFNRDTPLPYISNYKSPTTIGLDRLAVIAGANQLYPKNNVLVIDAGTAITYDIKSDTNQFLGGNISPGMNIRFKSLNHFTKNLPLIKAANTINLIGEQTEEAILNGVIKGISFEMEGMIEECYRNYTKLTVLLTGGDARFFDNMLKKTIFVIPNLVSVGLNTILNYNVEIN